MKVYIVVCEPYHDCSTVMGAFSTLEKAKASNGGVRWIDDGYYVKNRDNVVAQAAEEDKDGDQFLILEQEVF